MPTNNGAKVYINSRGEQVMRITQVIRVLAREQLVVWANLIGLDGIKYREEMDRTAGIGNMVHGVIEQYTSGELAHIDYEAYGVLDSMSRREARNAIDSFFLWYEDVKNDYHVRFTEKVVVGDKLGGTIDCGIDGFEDPRKVIFVDYKTSSAFHLSQFLQLAGYVKIYEEVYGKDTVEAVMVVLADKRYGKKARSRMIRSFNTPSFGFT